MKSLEKSGLYRGNIGKVRMQFVSLSCVLVHQEKIGHFNVNLFYEFQDSISNLT